MSSEDSKNNLLKGAFLFALLVIISIIEWIKDNPFTTVWMLAVAGYVVYLVQESRNGVSPPPNNQPPSDHH